MLERSSSFLPLVFPQGPRTAVGCSGEKQRLPTDIGKGNNECGSRKTESKTKSSKVLQKNKPTIGIGCTSNSCVMDIRFSNPHPSSDWAHDMKFNLRMDFFSYICHRLMKILISLQVQNSFFLWKGGRVGKKICLVSFKTGRAKEKGIWWDATFVSSNR